MRFIKTQREKELLEDINYLNHKVNMSGDLRRWRCCIRTCKGYIYVDTNNFIINRTEHICDMDNEKRQRVVIKYLIKEKARNTNYGIFVKMLNF